MKVNIQSIHFDADIKLLEYIQAKCNKLDSFFDRITDAQVYLKLEKGEAKQNKIVEIKLNLPGESLVATEKGSKFEEAVDLCKEKLKQQLTRYKEKLYKHHNVKPLISVVESEEDGLEDD